MLSNLVNSNDLLGYLKNENGKSNNQKNFCFTHVVHGIGG